MNGFLCFYVALVELHVLTFFDSEHLAARLSIRILIKHCLTTAGRMYIN